MIWENSSLHILFHLRTSISASVHRFWMERISDSVSNASVGSRDELRQRGIQPSVAKFRNLNSNSHDSPDSCSLLYSYGMRCHPVSTYVEPLRSCNINYFIALSERVSISGHNRIRTYSMSCMTLLQVFIEILNHETFIGSQFARTTAFSSQTISSKHV